MNIEFPNSLRKDKDREFIGVNDLLSYGRGKDYIHIHLVPEKKAENFMFSFREGMEKLAEMARDDETIKEVIAVSWIVAEHPRILERAGFTIDGRISYMLRKKHFSGEKRPVWKAHISREDLLKKYLKNEKTSNFD